MGCPFLALCCTKARVCQPRYVVLDSNPARFDNDDGGGSFASRQEKLRSTCASDTASAQKVALFWHTQLYNESHNATTESDGHGCTLPTERERA